MYSFMQHFTLRCHRRSQYIVSLGELYALYVAHSGRFSASYSITKNDTWTVFIK